MKPLSRNFNHVSAIFITCAFSVAIMPSQVFAASFSESLASSEKTIVTEKSSRQLLVSSVEEQLVQRLQELNNEYSTVEQQLAMAETQRSNIQMNLMQISGAIQVLETAISEDPTLLNEQARLNQLKNQQAIGQQLLSELDTYISNSQENLQRIAGAIQLLEEAAAF